MYKTNNRSTDVQKMVHIFYAGLFKYLLRHMHIGQVQKQQNLKLLKTSAVYVPISMQVQCRWGMTSKKVERDKNIACLPSLEFLLSLITCAFHKPSKHCSRIGHTCI